MTRTNSHRAHSAYRHLIVAGLLTLGLAACGDDSGDGDASSEPMSLEETATKFLQDRFNGRITDACAAIDPTYAAEAFSEGCAIGLNEWNENFIDLYKTAEVRLDEETAGDVVDVSGSEIYYTDEEGEEDNASFSFTFQKVDDQWILIDGPWE